MQCFKHLATESTLRCGKCERPICGRCVVFTPVGTRCRECARPRLVPTYHVPWLFLLRGLGAAVGAGAVAGVVLAFLVQAFFLLGFLAAAAAGFVVSEAVSLATNRKRGLPLQAVVVVGVVLSYLAMGFIGSVSLLNLYAILAFVAAIVIAVSRLR